MAAAANSIYASFLLKYAPRGALELREQACCHTDATASAAVVIGITSVQELSIQRIAGLGSNKLEFWRAGMPFRSNILLLAGWYLLASGVWAQQPAAGSTAYDVVQKTTVQVMEVVAGADAYVDADPERYYQAVQDVLDPVIDYRGFARSVMGPYASSERYRSLDEAGRGQLRKQLDRFTEVMRLSLVRTYSKGLLAFGGSRIELVEPPADVSAKSRVSVHQLIYNDDPEPYVVMYQMGRSKSGNWQLRNVIIESVNLGEIYRNQFQAAARKEEGNLDSVIDGWTTVTVEVES